MHKFEVGDVVQRVSQYEDKHWKEATADVLEETFVVSDLIGTGFIRLVGIPGFWSEYPFEKVSQQ